MAQLKSIQKDGPYGNKNAVQNFSMQLDGSEEYIKEVIIRSGFNVDAIGLTIVGPNGKCDTNTFGGNGGQQYKINLHNGEYITGISGISKGSFISQLRIHTTLHPKGHGPYGTDELKGGCTFKSQPLSQNDSIVGFFGTAYDNLVYLSLYVDKNSSGPQWVDKKCGPYGSQCPENYSFKLEECESIKEVIIRHGFIVDAIGFIVAKPNGSTYRKIFGGDNSNESKIVLKCGENITRISGTYGKYQYLGNNCVIATIKIHTNLCPNGYGPYGKGMAIIGGAHDFSSPLLDGPMTGVFGRHSIYLESLGIFYKKME